jgi:ubiquinone/menaquinone biosynthesis C-methylase UbiE
LVRREKRLTESVDSRESPVLAHYSIGYEKDRLNVGPGKLEWARTCDILMRYLPPPPAEVVDVGGGPGRYAAWLAAEGYEVELLDVVPLHVEQAQETFQALELTGARAEVGDARALPYASESKDVVLLLGPLYHLPARDDRLDALREARRVLRSNGLIAVAAISRFASLIDGFARGLVADPGFVRIVERDLSRGVHENPTGNPDYFTTAYFHNPRELRQELEAAGYIDVELVAVEGPFWSLQNLDDTWRRSDLRELMLRFLREIERDDSMLGASAHLLALARRPS